MTPAGKFRHGIGVDAPVRSDDGFGGFTVTWDRRFQDRAKLMWLRGGETVQASRLAGRQPVVVTVRSTQRTRAITNEWRVVLLEQSQPVNIRSVVESEDGREIEITGDVGVEVPA